MATKKTSTKFDTAHNIETEADLTNKTATVKNLVTGETYASGSGEGLPDISAGDAGKVLAVSDQLAAEWVAPHMLLTVGALEDSMLPLGVTNGEIKNALEAGKNITVIFPTDCPFYPGSTARITGIYKTDNGDNYFPMLIVALSTGDIQMLGMYGGALTAEAGIFYD